MCEILIYSKFYIFYLLIFYLNLFQYLVESKEINEWKSWDTNKLKSQKSFPLQDQHSATTSKNVKKIKLENNTEILNEAKLKLLHTLQTNEKEKKDYEIDLLKAKLEKEKLKIELLKVSIEREKALKDVIKKKETDISLIRSFIMFQRLFNIIQY